MPAEVVIVSCGMLTPVGLSARETAASTRSRTARLTSIEWRDSRFQPFTVGILPEEYLPPLHPELEELPLTFREGRMLRLAGRPLAEALAALPKTGSAPLLVGLPELHTAIPIQPDDFLKRLALQSGASLDLTNSRAFVQGRAAAILALQEAWLWLSEGKAPFAVVGGVDCNVDLCILGTLDMQKRVRTEVNPDGFAPGEGAAFVLLTTRELAQRYGLRVLAMVVGAAAATEEGHIYSDKPYRGEGLAAAFENLFASSKPPLSIGCVYASFNGENYWAKEFGVALLRHREHMADPLRTEHPAECFGDLGAGHGASLLALAALETSRADPRSITLVSASSDYGDRAVALLAGIG